MGTRNESYIHRLGVDLVVLLPWKPNQWFRGAVALSEMRGFLASKTKEPENLRRVSRKCCLEYTIHLQFPRRRPQPRTSLKSTSARIPPCFSIHARLVCRLTSIPQYSLRDHPIPFTDMEPCNCKLLIGLLRRIMHTDSTSPVEEYQGEIDCQQGRVEIIDLTEFFFPLLQGACANQTSSTRQALPDYSLLNSETSLRYHRSSLMSQNSRRGTTTKEPYLLRNSHVIIRGYKFYSQQLEPEVPTYASTSYIS